MLRFQLFSFPVAIHWSFWITAAFLSGLFRAGSPEQFQLGLLAVVVVAMSILWHELGHAFFMRRYGGSRPNIYLYWLGGLASTQTAGYSDRQKIIISAAGPAAGFLLAGVFFVVLAEWGEGMTPMARHVLGIGLFINIFWNLLNLIPVYPLDGGQILEAVIGGRRPMLVYQISLVVAIGAAVACLMAGLTFFAILLGFLAYENYQRMNFRSPRSPW